MLLNRVTVLRYASFRRATAIPGQTLRSLITCTGDSPSHRSTLLLKLICHVDSSLPCQNRLLSNKYTILKLRWVPARLSSSPRTPFSQRTLLPLSPGNSGISNFTLYSQTQKRSLSLTPPSPSFRSQHGKPGYRTQSSESWFVLIGTNKMV